jgi:hypothetical protein
MIDDALPRLSSLNVTMSKRSSVSYSRIFSMKDRPTMPRPTTTMVFLSFEEGINTVGAMEKE